MTLKPNRLKMKCQPGQWRWPFKRHNNYSPFFDNLNKCNFIYAVFVVNPLRKLFRQLWK